MMKFKRFAIYYAPEDGALADFGAAWLGWDARTGAELPHPPVDNLPLAVSEITATPRKYGFHGTVKPPFRLAPGATADDLDAAARALCAQRAPVTLQGLHLSRLGSFLALTPVGDARDLADLAGAAVQGLDRFRAPLTEAEIAKRNPDRLSAPQRALLDRWGYPYVLDEFRFHLTLSGRLNAEDAAKVESALAPQLAPLLPRPFVINSLCLFGEAHDGRFHLIHRYGLSG